jgi:hypothetical protein
MPHNEKLASTTTDDVGQTAQLTSKDCELPIINKMTPKDSAGPRLHVQTPGVPSSVADVALTPSVNKRLGETSHLTMGATPLAMVPTNCVQHMADPQDLPMEQMIMQFDTSIDETVSVEDAYEKADSPLIALVVTEDGSNQSSIEIKEREPQSSNDLVLEATIPLDIIVIKIEGLHATTHIEDIVLVEDGSDDEEEDPTAAFVDYNSTLSQPPIDLLREVMPPPDDDMHLLPTGRLRQHKQDAGASLTIDRHLVGVLALPSAIV